MRICCVALAVAACKGTPEPSSTGSGSGSVRAPRDAALAAVPIVDAAVDTTIDAAVAAAPFSTIISSAGVGPFHVKTPDDEAAIAKLVPGFDVTPSVNESEAHELHEYTIGHGTTQSLFVIMDAYRDGAIATIDVFDPMFATASGIRVGSTIGELAAAHADVVCRFERYDADLDVYRVEQRLYCEIRSLPNVSFELDSKAWRGLPGKLAVSKLASRKISTIIWGNPTK